MFIKIYYVIILIMSNRFNKKVIDIEPIPTIPQTKTKAKAKPKAKPKQEFSEAAREGWLAYQDLRDDNKILTHLNKKYSITTLKRRQELKQKLASNPIFINDYKKILDAYNNKNIKLDEKDMEILEIFEFKALE
jgi:hypothetical protein